MIGKDNRLSPKDLQEGIALMVKQGTALKVLVDRALQDVTIPEGPMQRLALSNERTLRSFVAVVLVGVQSPNPDNLWGHLREKLGDEALSSPIIQRARAVLSNHLAGDVVEISRNLSLIEKPWREVKMSLIDHCSGDEARALSAALDDLALDKS